MVLLGQPASSGEPPTAVISGGGLTAKLFLPDAQNGYYRGTRFDWSGQIGSLRSAKHEYFGQWFERYDPKLHDAIQGPVEEFHAEEGGLGFAEAQPGESFVRIGVGAVRRTDRKPYERFRTHEIVDPGVWKVTQKKNQITFLHTLRHASGYAYEYRKTITLQGDRQMVIAHELKNVGRLPIPAVQYNHNFFVMDGQRTGEATEVDFPFTLQPLRAPAPELATVQGGAIRYKRSLQKGESVFGTFQGFRETPADYDVRVANRKSGAAVRIRGDRPIAQLVFWSIPTTVCPEPYIRVDTAPGAKSKWSYTYQFE